MRRKRGWERKREGEGGRKNLRLDGVSPALSLTFAKGLGWRVAGTLSFTRKIGCQKRNRVPATLRKRNRVPATLRVDHYI
jgi:hypothetical protein